MLTGLALLLCLTPLRPIAGQVAHDSSLGKLVKIITIDGEFVMLDKSDSTHAFMRDNSYGGIVTNFRIGPEMDCFLVNHEKEPLRITYELYQRDGSSKKLNNATRIVSLQTGDDTRTWAQKEGQNPELLKRHHEQLRKIREEGK